MMKYLLLDVIRFWERKLEKDECTKEELQRLAKILMDNFDVLVTVKDISEIYHKPSASVKVCLSRNNITDVNPPKVRKFYSLNAFRKIMPKSWAKQC